MTTDAAFDDQIIDELQSHRVTFAHSPTMWGKCNLPINLNWQSVEFGEDYLEHVPSDQRGVYAFMLRPDFKGPPKSAYLLYIGKTCRTFQDRYDEYLRRELRRFGRTIIGRMLERWSGHIWFHYASIEDESLIEDVEDALLNSCVPPYNQRYRGRVGTAIMAFKSEMAAGG